MTPLLIAALIMSPNAPGDIESAEAGRQGHMTFEERLAKGRVAGAARDRGRALMEKGQVEEAILAFREAVAIEETYDYHVSTSKYALAQALATAKQYDEALDLYRRSLRWVPEKREIWPNGPPVAHITNDYAILLAQQGKHEEAKAVYYSALRQFNPYAAGTFEPYPFLVVFDPDPTMTVWDYSPERLIAAARMNQLAMKGGGSKEEVTEVLDAVQAVAPEWVFPAVYRFFQSSNDDRPAVLDFAESLCATDEELNWVRPYRPLLEIEWTERLNRYRVMRAEVAQVGLERRKNSAVLQKAQDDLERLWPRIAVTFDQKDG